MAIDLALKFVTIEDMDKLSVADLGTMASEADLVKGAVQTELKRRSDEVLATLKNAGYVPAGEAPTPSGRGRGGRKPKSGKEDAPELSAAAADTLEAGDATGDQSGSSGTAGTHVKLVHAAI